MSTPRRLTDTLLVLLPISLLVAWWRLPLAPVPIYVPEILAVGYCALVWIRGGRESWRRLTSVVGPAFAIGLGMILVGALVGVLVAPSISDALGAAKTWILIPGLLCLGLLFDSERPFQPVMIGLVIFALAETLWGTWGLLLNETDRLTGTFLSANMYAAAVAPIAVGLAFMARQKPNYWILVVLLTLGVCLSQSLGGLIALSAGLGLVLLQAAKPRTKVVVGGLIAILLIVAALIASDRTRLGPENSFNSRIQIWHTALYLGSAHPVVGTGLRGFDDRYALAVPHFYPEPIEWSVPEPHNLLLAFWLDLGLAGLIGFGLLLYLCLIRRSYLFGQVALITILVHGVFDTPFFKTELAFLFWIYIAWALAHRKPDPSDASHAAND